MKTQQASFKIRLSRENLEKLKRIQSALPFPPSIVEMANRAIQEWVGPVTPIAIDHVKPSRPWPRK